MPRIPVFLSTLIAASLGFAIIQLDVTVLNVALPALAHALGASITQLQWVIDAYVLAFASLLLTGGYLGDRFGAHRIYSVGLIIFMLACIGCALSASTYVLIFWRVAQGAGAALMLPSSLALINHATHNDPERRTRAIAHWTACGAIAIAAGPLIGGWLITVTAWQSIFWVNLPVALVALWLVRKLDSAPIKSASAGFDPLGQILGPVCLASITAAFMQIGHNTVAALAFGLFGIAASVCFVMWERKAPSPMLPLALFGSRTFSACCAFGTLINLCYYGLTFVLSLYFQGTLGLSAAHTGMAFVPLTVTLFLANLISASSIRRLGARAVMSLGALLCACGFALLAALPVFTTNALHMSAMLAMISAGVGLAVPAMTSTMLANIPKEQSGTAAATLNTARQTGGAMGVAVFGTLLGTQHAAQGLRLVCALAAALLVLTALLARMLPAHDDRSRKQLGEVRI